MLDRRSGKILDNKLHFQYTLSVHALLNLKITTIVMCCTLLEILIGTKIGGKIMIDC